MEPSPENGLTSSSFIMTEKSASVRRSILSERIGVLEGSKMDEVSQQLRVVLGILRSPYAVGSDVWIIFPSPNHGIEDEAGRGIPHPLPD